MSSEGPTSQSSQTRQMCKSNQYLVGRQVLPSKTQWGNRRVQWMQEEQNTLQASGGIKKLSCLLQNICNMLLAQGKWVRCFPQEPLHPGRAGAEGPADGCWGCLSVRKTGNEKSMAPSTADFLMTDSSPIRPQAQRAAGALPPRAVSAPELSLLSGAERGLPRCLCGLDLALG